MKKRTLAAVAALMLLTACGSSDSASYSSAKQADAYENYAAEANYETMAAMASDEADAGDYGDYDEDGGDHYKDTESPKTNVSDASQTQLTTAAKMIYTGTVQLETLQYDDTVAAIKADIESMGGFVETSSEQNDNKRWYYDKAFVVNRVYTVKARIPSENFTGFVDKIGKYGQKMYESTNAENISRQYADTEAQIKALESELDRLLEMMNSADTIEEMITVEDRVTNVQSQLNTMRSRLSNMDSDVRYSTVNVTVTEVHEYTEVVTEPEPEPDPPTFFERTGELIAESAKSFLGVLEGLLDVIIVLFPYLLIGGVILFFVIRAHRKKKKARMQAMSVPPQPPAPPQGQPGAPSDAPATPPTYGKDSPDKDKDKK
ncbi:MAG: DUF4349 domain-containing protein [Oscillospiraceae bacterium]|nr:DUF4349 domain-containing protein [Oscillospiraceae bacterium]